MKKLLKNFFFFCSGANTEILRDNDCLIEHNKYIGIGGTILATAVLAVISGSYALHTVFKIGYIAIGFGLLWGVIIFNLDRYIISTMKKRRIDPNLSRRERLHNLKTTLAMVVPRFMLAGIISFVITKPIELRMFEKEIDDQINATSGSKIAERKASINARYKEIDELNVINTALKQEVEAKRERRDDLREIAIAEGNGIGSTHTTGKMGLGPAYRDRVRAVQIAESELNDLKTKNEGTIAENKKTIKALETERDEQIKKAEAAILGANDLLERLKAMSVLSSDNTVWWTSWLLVAVFLMLETAPIIVKLLSDRGPYDFKQETLEHTVYANERKKTSDLNDQINTDVALSKELNAGRLKAELDLSKGTMASLLSLASIEIKAAQMEIAKLVVLKWKNAELARMRLDPNQRLPRVEPLINNQPDSAIHAQTSPVFSPGPAGNGEARNNGENDPMFATRQPARDTALPLAVSRPRYDPR